MARFGKKEIKELKGLFHEGDYKELFKRLFDMTEETGRKKLHNHVSMLMRKHVKYEDDKIIGMEKSEEIDIINRGITEILARLSEELKTKRIDNPKEEIESDVRLGERTGNSEIPLEDEARNQQKESLSIKEEKDSSIEKTPEIPFDEMEKSKSILKFILDQIKQKPWIRFIILFETLLLLMYGVNSIIGFESLEIYLEIGLIIITTFLGLFIGFYIFFQKPDA